MDWEKLLPFLVVGGIVIAAMSAMRPGRPIVINPNPPIPPREDDSVRLQAGVQLAELAVQRDIARMQAETELRGKQYELGIARMQIEAGLLAKQLEFGIARMQIEAELQARKYEFDIARMQIEANLRGKEYDLEAKRLEAETERRRIDAEKEVALAQTHASFWGSFWSGLFGLGMAVALLLSDEALYQKAIPSYYPRAGQLAYLARRDYGNMGKTRTLL